MDKKLNKIELISDNITDKDIKKKLLLITDSDSDGIGCAVYAGKLSNIEASICFTHPSKVDYVFEQLYSSFDKYDIVIIADLSLSIDNARKFDKFYNKYNGDKYIGLFDHHESNKLFKYYKWAYVNVEDSTLPEGSACIVLKDALVNIFPKAEFLNYAPSISTIEEGDNLDELLESISRYDTWEWRKNPRKYAWGTEEENDYADQYTSIMIEEKGPERALKEILLNLSLIGTPFNKMDIDIYVSKYKNDESRKIQHAIDNVVITNYNEYKVGIILPSEKFGNSEMEAIYTTFPDIDIVFGLYPSTRTLSMRSNKNDLNLSRLAKSLGGGGHKQAAGAKIAIDLFLALLEIYYTNQ